MRPTQPGQQRHWELWARQGGAVRIQPSGILSSPALLFGHSMAFSLGFLLLPKPGTGLLQEHGQKPSRVINQQLLWLMRLGGGGVGGEVGRNP